MIRFYERYKDTDRVEIFTGDVTGDTLIGLHYDSWRHLLGSVDGKQYVQEKEAFKKLTAERFYYVNRDEYIKRGKKGKFQRRIQELETPLVSIQEKIRVDGKSRLRLIIHPMVFYQCVKYGMRYIKEDMAQSIQNLRGGREHHILAVIWGFLLMDRGKQSISFEKILEKFGIGEDRHDLGHERAAGTKGREDGTAYYAGLPRSVGDRLSGSAGYLRTARREAGYALSAASGS